MWYAEHLAKANLPTSTISEEAIQAGRAYDPESPPKATPKRRRRPGDPITMPKFQMSPDRLQKLCNSGLPVIWGGKGPNPYVRPPNPAGGFFKSPYELGKEGLPQGNYPVPPETTEETSSPCKGAAVASKRKSDGTPGSIKRPRLRSEVFKDDSDEAENTEVEE